MTTEEKAKAYDEALKRVEAAINIAADKDLVKGVATTIFPELRESEDERIKKIITDSVFYQYGAGAEYKDVLDYLDKLERQKEQEPAEPSDEELVRHPSITYTYPSDASRDEQLKRALLALLNSDLIKVAGNEFTKQDLIDWVEKQKEQKPAEWSQKDEDRIRQIERIAQQAGCTQKLQEEIHDWLKSLRPSWKPSEVCYGAKGDPDPAGAWKPSEEQMDEIEYPF